MTAPTAAVVPFTASLEAPTAAPTPTEATPTAAEAAVSAILTATHPDDKAKADYHSFHGLFLHLTLLPSGEQPQSLKKAFNCMSEFARQSHKCSRSTRNATITNKRIYRCGSFVHPTVLNVIVVNRQNEQVNKENEYREEGTGEKCVAGEKGLP